MSDSKTGANILAAILPPIALFFVYWATHDAMCILLTLTLCYTLIPIIYDNFVYNLRWEFKFGPEITKWQTKSIDFIMMFIIGAGLSFGLWFLAYASGIFKVDVEVTPLTFTVSNIAGYLYYSVIILMFVLIVPVTEELFWRGFVQQDQFLGSFLSIIMYVAINHIKFMFVFPQRGWWIVFIDTVFLIAAGVLNILGKRGIIGACGFSMGLSVGWLLRVIILGRVGGERFGSQRGLLRDPKIFLLHDWQNIWN